MISQSCVLVCLFFVRLPWVNFGCSQLLATSHLSVSGPDSIVTPCMFLGTGSTCLQNAHFVSGLHYTDGSCRRCNNMGHVHCTVTVTGVVATAPTVVCIEHQKFCHIAQAIDVVFDPTVWPKPSMCTRSHHGVGSPALHLDTMYTSVTQQGLTQCTVKK